MKKGFRDEFKYYKRKGVPPDLSNVVCFSKFDDFQCPHQNSIKLVNCVKGDKKWKRIFGMTDPSEWRVYEFLNKPGLIYIKNPFFASGQRYWIIRCLEYYTKKPSKLNIDAHGIINPREDWWEYCQREISTEAGRSTLEKLRWATFGYHHNWDTKEYSESSKCPFPLDLKTLCSYIAEVLEFPTFNAEAAIINMYHFGSSLSGHTDHSEINLEAPLFSFSFGQSAIFLIGGKSIDDEVIPILIESGDILVMSRESRLCYHGVPKIIPAEKQPWSCIKEQPVENCESDNFLSEIIDKLRNNTLWEPFDLYVNKSRINMNVRQVLFLGQNSLNR